MYGILPNIVQHHAAALFIVHTQRVNWTTNIESFGSYYTYTPTGLATDSEIPNTEEVH